VGKKNRAGNPACRASPLSHGARGKGLRQKKKKKVAASERREKIKTAYSSDLTSEKRKKKTRVSSRACFFPSPPEGEESLEHKASGEKGERNLSRSRYWRKKTRRSKVELLAFPSERDGEEREGLGGRTKMFPDRLNRKKEGGEGKKERKGSDPSAMHPADFSTARAEGNEPGESRKAGGMNLRRRRNVEV